MITLFKFIAFIPVAHAQSYYSKYCRALGTYCGDGGTFIIHLADRVVTALIVPLIGGIAVIAVLWASVKLITSYGNDQGKEDAKKIITLATLGIGLAVLALAIVKFVCYAVQVATGGSGLCGAIF
jgi:hypothetical protein